VRGWEHCAEEDQEAVEERISTSLKYLTGATVAVADSTLEESGFEPVAPLWCDVACSRNEEKAEID
jgi:hypothetical protein